MKRFTTVVAALACILAMSAVSRLDTRGTARTLTVDGEPFFILGGELGNSAATCDADIERIFPRLAAMNLNTVLVPAYWDLTEPEE